MFNLAESRKITHIAAGLNYNIIIENRRTIYAWGVNTFG
jgi:alpha-tubulin suppressor-like RCC1 family protein